MKQFLTMLPAFMCFTLITVSKSVRITNLKVPLTYTVEHSNNLQPLILDCEYEMEDHEKGFVLKWFFNNNCIYQWIPSVKGFALGLMKSRINTGSISSEKNPGFISIPRPDWNMTGEYTCLVQTFESTDKRSARLQIIVPESNFGLKLKLTSEKRNVNAFCNVANVFPQPTLIVLINNQKLTGILSEEIRGDDGLYSVTVKTEIAREKLEQPTPITCVFFLSGTNYTKRKETIFYDHPSVSTTADPNKEEISSAISRLEAEKGSDEGSNIHTKWHTIAIAMIIASFNLTS